MRHSRAITSLAFSPDGELLASSSLVGNVVAVWNVETEQKVWEFHVLSNYAGISFDPSGKHLAASQRRTLKVVNVEKGRIICEFSHTGYIFSFSFSHDGEYLLTRSENHMNMIIIWDLKTRKKVYEFIMDKQVVAVLGIMLDRWYILTISEDFTENHTVTIWVLKTMRKIREIKLEGRVEYVNISADGKYLALGLSCGDIRIYEWRKGILVATYKVGYYANLTHWFKRFFACRGQRRYYKGTYYDITDVIHLQFAEYETEGNACMSMCISNRGFLTFGRLKGEIEMIREGKGI